MSVVLTSVVPLFAVVFVGYFAGRARFMSEAGVKALVAFVFNFAMPPFLFRLMAQTDLAEIAQWAFVGAYSLGALVMFAIGAAAAAVLFRLPPAGLIIQASARRSPTACCSGCRCCCGCSASRARCRRS